MKRNRKREVSIFSSFKEENDAEHARLANMSPIERLTEFSILQKRAWGRKWTHSRIVRTARFEQVNW